MSSDSQPNKPQSTNSTALKLQVVRPGRRVAGAGKRAPSPSPFLHLHPANANAPENAGVASEVHAALAAKFGAPANG